MVQQSQGEVEVEKQGTVTVDVSPDGANVSPLAEEGTVVTGDFRTELNVVYSTNLSQQIRIEEVYGGWSQTEQFTLWDREVGYTTGTMYDPYTEHQQPASNSFRYVTGWGWDDHYPPTDLTGPRAYANTTYVLAGTGGSGLREEVFLALPGPEPA